MPFIYAEAFKTMHVAYEGVTKLQREDKKVVICEMGRYWDLGKEAIAEFLILCFRN